MKNFVIDHVIRGIMVNKSGEYQWSVNQITDPSLSVTMGDAATAVDALGTTIATFDRGRNASFTASNSIFDLGLYAAQLGQQVKNATSSAKIKAPAFETIEVPSPATTPVELKNTPIANPSVIYKLNGDGSLGEAFAVGTEAASATTFLYDSETNKITLPTGATADEEYFVIYEYEMSDGSSVEADAINMPKKGKFILEVLGCDVCDQESLIHAYVIFPNAKLDGAVDYSFTTDGNHPFTINAQQDYCDSKKKLFSIVIPE